MQGMLRTTSYQHLHAAVSVSAALGRARNAPDIDHQGCGEANEHVRGAEGQSDAGEQMRLPAGGRAEGLGTDRDRIRGARYYWVRRALQPKRARRDGAPIAAGVRGLLI